LGMSTFSARAATIFDLVMGLAKPHLPKGMSRSLLKRSCSGGHENLLPPPESQRTALRRLSLKEATHQIGPGSTQTDPDDLKVVLVCITYGHAAAPSSVFAVVFAHSAAASAGISRYPLMRRKRFWAATRP